MKSRRLLWFVAVLFWAGIGFCQITTVTADQAPPIHGAGHDYIKLMNETVVPASGAVNLEVAVGVPPARDITVPFAIGYDSNSARHFSDGSPVIHDNGGYLAQGGWRFVVPQLQTLLNRSQILGDPSSQSSTYEIDLGLWPKGVPTPGMSVAGGFAGGVNGTYCNAYDSYSFTEPNGTMHPLGINIGPSRYQGCSLLNFATDVLQNTNGVFTGTTSATAQLNVGNNPAPAPVTVFDHDGTAFSFSNALARLHGVGRYFNTNTTHDGTTLSTVPANTVNYKTSLPDFIETRNGNQTVLADNDSNFNSTGSFQITDTLGRPAVQASGFGNPSGDTITVSGFSQPYTVSWGTVSYNWNYNAHIVAPTLQPAPYYGCATPSGNNTGSIRTASTLDAQGTVVGSSTVVTAIHLPNGLSYQFLYDNPNNDNPYGLLREIIYPNGAYVRYVWGLNPQSISLLYPPGLVVASAPGAPPLGWSCEAILDTPAIQKRFVSFDGVHEVQEQDFQYSTSWVAVQNPPSHGAFQKWSQKTTTVTTHDNVTNISWRTVYTYEPQEDLVLGNDPQSQLAGASGVPQAHPVEKTVQYFDTTGALLRSVAKSYSMEYLPPDILTTLDNGQSSYVHNVYSSSSNVVTDIFAYDFGVQADPSAPGPHGPLLRHDHADYSHVFPLNPLMSPAAPFNTGITDRPSAVITYDGTGRRVAETDFGYDETSVASTSATGHDDPNFGASFVNGRGNATTKIARCFNAATQTTCPQGDSTTVYGYDQTGQQVSKKDPNSNMTTYSFADSFFDPTPPSNATTPPGSTNGYLTRITYPATNGVSHIESFSYAYTDGSLTLLTDENGNQTKYTYNDLLRRLTATAFPDNGQTSISYSDAGANPQVVTTKKIDSGRNLITTVETDGMGHPIQTQFNSDPEGVDYTDTTYDGLGRVISASNPHRSASAPTDGVTQTHYDALGRVIQVTKQDGSISSISYAANCSVATDEAGRRRRSCSDALGRLIEVDEPTPGVSETIQATSATAAVTLSGSLESKPSSNPATGTITISGTDSIVPGTNAYDYGTVTVTIGNASLSASYGNGGSSPSAASDVASALCNAVNSTSSTSAQVSCNPNGAVMNLTAQAPGTAGNGLALAVSARTQFPQSNQSAFASSFTSGSLSGGGTLMYDSGTISVTILGRGYSVSWFGSTTTAAGIVSSLASAVNGDSTGFATASASGNTLTVAAKDVGMSGNGIALSCASSYDSSDFSAPSFTIACPSSLSGGHEAGSLSAPMITLYSYDALGNLLQATQQGGTTDQSKWRIRNFSYDSLSRLLTASNPESGTISYSYDADGNMLTKTAPAPNQPQGSTATVTTSYTYDALNRLTKKTYSDGKTPIVGYAYDLSAPWGWQLSNYIGRLVIDSTADAQSGTLLNASQYNYDAMGRVVLNEQGCTNANCSVPSDYVAYTFDLAGDVTSQTDAQSGVFNVTYSYTYDTAERVTGMTSSFVDSQHPATLASNIAYDATGGMQQMTYGNGLTATEVRNKRLQPCRGNVNSSGTVLQQCTDAVPGNTVQDFSYGFSLGSGDNGNVISMTGAGQENFNRTYTYDSLNRLAGMSAPGDACSAMNWTYDAWGNRMAQTCTAGSTSHSGSWTLLTNNQLAGYGYDVAGNLINDGIHAYTYDAENRVISVDNGATTYSYDAQGHRVTKTVGGVWRNYLFDTADRVVAETTSPGWQVGYGYLLGQLLTQYRDSTTYFFQHDQLGSTRVMTRLDKTPYDSMDYLPYGEQIAGDTGSSHKFTGKERDSETALDYFGARYYESTLGRFMTPDWSSSPAPVPYVDLINPQTLNQYAYVHNNPMSFGDPDGHCCLDEITDFTVGLLNAWGSDNLAGAGRMEQTSVSGKFGQAIGDLGATVQGALETGLSGAGEVAGVGLDGTGVLAPAGLTVNAVSTAGLIHGSVTTATAGTNFFKDLTGNGGGSKGEDFTPSAKNEIDARDGSKCQNCGRDVQSVQNKKGQATPANQRQRHHITPKSEGGKGTAANGKTLCPACHKEEHRKMRQTKKKEQGN